MVHSDTPEPVGADQSLGDLVALAAKDMSQLIRYEIELAKSELGEDVRRIALAVVLVAGAAFAGCLVLVILCIAYAEGLAVAFDLPRWVAFLICAATLVLLAAIAVGIAMLRVRGMSGLRKTRQSVTEGLEVLRLNGQQPDGQRPQLPGRETR